MVKNMINAIKRQNYIMICNIYKSEKISSLKIIVLNT